MEATIRAMLADLEQEEDIRVLLAVESGSRAWGFASENSDWDVRFVYVRRMKRYLSIDRVRDVIERQLPNDLDVAGWDLPKALGLFAKSNPALLEWMRSPIVYAKDEFFTGRLTELESDFVRLEAGLYHYRSMALTNWQRNLSGDLVSLKKYLYVIRPILACLYIERTAQWPPTLFADLRASEVRDGELGRSIDDLVEAKSKSGELGRGPRVAILDRFIEEELARLQSLDLDASPKVSLEPLDELFRECLARFDVKAFKSG